LVVVVVKVVMVVVVMVAVVVVVVWGGAPPPPPPPPTPPTPTHTDSPTHTNQLHRSMSHTHLDVTVELSALSIVDTALTRSSVDVSRSSSRPNTASTVLLDT
jgi:hypothetical protein